MYACICFYIIDIEPYLRTIDGLYPSHALLLFVSLIFMKDSNNVKSQLLKIKYFESKIQKQIGKNAYMFIK